MSQELAGFSHILTCTNSILVVYRQLISLRLSKALKFQRQRAGNPLVPQINAPCGILPKNDISPTAKEYSMWYLMVPSMPKKIT
jgi:hypothetical protein